MRRFSLVCLAFLVGFALTAVSTMAQEATAPQPAPAEEKAQPPAPEKATPGKEMLAIVISTNDAAKTLTVKKETDPLRAETELERTFKVEDKAFASLKSIRPGQTVKLQLKKDATGKEIVSAIEQKTATSPEKK